MFALEKLNVYTKALNFSNNIYDLTKSWPKISKMLSGLKSSLK